MLKIQNENPKWKIQKEKCASNAPLAPLAPLMDCGVCMVMISIISNKNVCGVINAPLNAPLLRFEWWCQLCDDCVMIVCPYGVLAFGCGVPGLRQWKSMKNEFKIKGVPLWIINKSSINEGIKYGVIVVSLRVNGVWSYVFTSRAKPVNNYGVIVVSLRLNGVWMVCGKGVE